jgi:hypothetical protein
MCLVEAEHVRGAATHRPYEAPRGGLRSRKRGGERSRMRRSSSPSRTGERERLRSGERDGVARRGAGDGERGEREARPRGGSMSA